jgi:hypothetical protein
MFSNDKKHHKKELAYNHIEKRNRRYKKGKP